MSTKRSTPNDRAGSIASYSLIIIGSFWTVFGTSATICYDHCSSATTGGLVPVFEALLPLPGTAVIRADLTWNLIGVLLMSLGLLSYKYTRERIVDQHSRMRKIMVAGMALIMFIGMFVLDTGLQFHYIYCYLPGPVALFSQLDCANIFSFPGVLAGVVTTVLGSIGLAAVTLSTISLTVSLRQRMPVT